MKFFLLIFQLSIIIGMYSCKKDTPPVDNTPQLPPETQTGANTFGCLVNGQVWLPKGAGLVPTFYINYGNKAIALLANKFGIDPHEYMNINCGPLSKDTTFTINNYSDTSGFQNFRYSIGTINYYPINQYNGQFHLTKLDTINRIVSGTFWFDAINTSNNEIVQIRDGRFDVKY